MCEPTIAQDDQTVQRDGRCGKLPRSNLAAAVDNLLVTAEVIQILYRGPLEWGKKGMTERS